MREVQNIIKAKKIPLVECHSVRAAEQIVQVDDIKCNFIYIMPKSASDLKAIMIRRRYGLDTADELNHKINLIRAEMERVKSFKWINQIVVNDGSEEEFLKKAGVYLAWSLYQIRT